MESFSPFIYCRMWKTITQSPRLPVASRGRQRLGRGGSSGGGLPGHRGVWMRGLPPTPQRVLQP